jgi:hypothetical protein
MIIFSYYNPIIGSKTGYTGTPENIKEIKYFLPEGSFVKKEESGIFYLNTVKELFFLNHKKAKESVLIKESVIDTKNVQYRYV